jgi:hypothetical protein
MMFQLVDRLYGKYDNDGCSNDGGKGDGGSDGCEGDGCWVMTTATAEANATTLAVVHW